MPLTAFALTGAHPELLGTQQSDVGGRVPADVQAPQHPADPSVVST